MYLGGITDDIANCGSERPGVHDRVALSLLAAIYFVCYSSLKRADLMIAA